MSKAPVCLSDYISSGRSDSFEPDRDFELLSAEFKTFWLSLQPIWRTQSSAWPPPKDSSRTSDWSVLQKGGPNGIYLVLKSLAFLAKMAWFADERKVLEDMVEDVNWALGEITKYANGGSVLGKRRNNTRSD